MRDADTAMDEAQHAGRATLVAFDDTMRARLMRAVQIDSGLRGAQQWMQWQHDDARHAPATVSVNLSRLRTSLGEELPRQVREVLDELGMPAGALQREIAESEVAKGSPDRRELLATMYAMGVTLAMDDFGVGASSLGLLREHPFDTIEIDKSFVTDLCRDPQVPAVAHATIHPVENLGMTSVAEGIEEPGELATLQSLGCRHGQGFLFSWPVGGDELLGVVARLGAEPAADGQV